LTSCYIVLTLIISVALATWLMRRDERRKTVETVGRAAALADVAIHDIKVVFHPLWPLVRKCRVDFHTDGVVRDYELMRDLVEAAEKIARLRRKHQDGR
jgi:hypothetical protein